jgi:ADP-dependent NAD(P)H-hydrate dehydratase / NAD(P)H-hydrate epimerase
MPVPVISIAQMREWEQATWASGQTEVEVIRRVGRCVAHHAGRLTRPGERVLILAGKGNNGEDARCAREHLTQRFVEVLAITDPAVDGAKLDAELSLRPALIIDGLFGIGLSRPLSPEWVKLIQRINTSGLPVLAVDVPSGLNADTGEPQGAAIQAVVTLTVGAPKAGLLREPAWPFVGQLVVASDVGLVSCPHKSELQWTLPEDFIGFPPARAAATHKGNYGHLAIVAGSLGYHGAAVLAARGALRAQPGLVTVQTLESVYHAVAPQLQAVMVSAWQPGIKWAGEADAVLVGPGLAAADMPDSMKMQTRHLWRDLLIPVVTDASALDWLPLDPVPRNAVRVITPHPGEAARLLRTTPQAVQADRLKALRTISRRFGNSWVVLKGHQTLIGRSTGEVYVNPSGNPHLAQGGSGDVLAGYLAGLLVQPQLRADVLQTIRYAVWQHGASADYLQTTQPNWIVKDLAAVLGSQEPRAWRDSGQPSA